MVLVGLVGFFNRRDAEVAEEHRDFGKSFSGADWWGAAVKAAPPLVDFLENDGAAVGEVGAEVAVEGVVEGAGFEAFEAVEFGGVGVEDVFEGSRDVSGDAVVGDAVVGMEVEGEDEVGAFELNGEVALIDVEELGGGGFEDFVVAHEFEHRLFEVLQAAVFEVGVVGEVPLTTGVFVGPVVAFAWEVDPLGVAEFVADEAEPGFATGNHGEEANHFVEGNAAVDDGTFVRLFHLPIHLFVHEPEGEGLVADEALVVGLGVGHGLFAIASVRKLIPKDVKVPLFVGGVFEEFDPVVGDAHAEAIVEAESAVGGGLAAAGHAGKIFRDSEGPRKDFTDEGVGELKVGNSAPVDAVVEVFVVVVEGGVAMMVVEHGGDSIEAEAVEAEVFKPIGKVGEEKALGGGVAVVEEKGVPLFVLAGGAAVEEVAFLAIEFANAFGEVFDSVGVNEVENNRDT